MNSNIGKRILFVIIGVLLGFVLFLYFTPNFEAVQIANINAGNINLEDEEKPDEDYDDFLNEGELVDQNSYHRYLSDNIVRFGRNEPTRYFKISKNNNRPVGNNTNIKPGVTKPNNNKDITIRPKPSDSFPINNGNIVSGGHKVPPTHRPPVVNSTTNNKPTPKPSVKPDKKPEKPTKPENKPENKPEKPEEPEEPEIHPEPSQNGMALAYNTKTNKETKLNVEHIENIFKKKSMIPLDKEFMIKGDRFGKRKDPISNNPSYHIGLDLGNKKAMGREVFAMLDGEVSYINLGENKTNYGNIVVIKHNDFSTSYSHLKGFARNLEVGQKVTAGDVIGYLGNSGRTSKPHLHLEINYKNHKIDPEHFLGIIDKDFKK